MSDHRLYCEIMRLAADAAGGEEALARRLRRARQEVDAWLEGRELAPFGVYVEALELLWRRTQGGGGRR